MNVQGVLKRVDALQPMPAVAVRLLAATQDPDVDLGEVAAWLERDPAMTANLLRLCNSSFYSLRHAVSSVRQATSLLGLNRVVQLAFTLLSSRYLAPAQPGYELAAGELWKSSVATAIAAELIAQRGRYPNPSAAYTAGLLQNVGKIVLAEYVHGALTQIQHLVREEGLSWEGAERRTVGLSHPEVGAIVLVHWETLRLCRRTVEV